MQIKRRSLLSMVSASALLPAVALAADDPRMAPRSIGLADAKVVVTEYFSLTCIHCAAFARETLPQVKAQLVATGKIRLVFGDFPLDRLALTAAQVARALPPERYDPFIEALLASQDRWAFARGADTIGELSKIAALAGMSQDTFNATIADTGLRNWIVAQQTADQKQYGIDSTPTFLIGGKTYPGAMEFDEFAKLVAGVG